MRCMKRFLSTHIVDTELWVALSGFSRLATRRDLMNFIDNVIEVDGVDPILNNHAYPCGKWVLRVRNEDSITVLKKKVDQRSSLSLSKLTYTKHLSRASRLGISNCTVRLRNVPHEIGQEELIYFFQDFGLRPNPFQVKNLNGETLNDTSFIHFISEQEAMRAMYLKNFHVLQGKSLNMIHYNM